jgi:hypothetical protein
VQKIRKPRTLKPADLDFCLFTAYGAFLPPEKYYSLFVPEEKNVMVFASDPTPFSGKRPSFIACLLREAGKGSPLTPALAEKRRLCR